MMALGISSFRHIASLALLTAAWMEVTSAFVVSGGRAFRPFQNLPLSSSALSASVVDTTARNGAAQSRVVNEEGRAFPDDMRWTTRTVQPVGTKVPKTPSQSKPSRVSTQPNLSPIQKTLLVDLRKDESNVVLGALQELNDLCSKDDDSARELRSLLYQMGGPAVIVGVMLKEEFSNVARIQAAGFRLLHSLAQSCASFQQSINSVGVLDTVAVGMKSHSDDVDVQVYGCGVMGEAILSSKENADYCVNSLNTIDLIVSAMKKFPSEARVQLNGSIALFFLLEWNDFKNLIVEADGDRALMEARKNHVDESNPCWYVEHIQKWTRLALLRVFE